LQLSKRKEFKRGWITLLSSLALFILGATVLEIGSGTITFIEGIGTIIMFLFFFTMFYGIYFFIKTFIRLILGKNNYKFKKHFGIASGIIIVSFILSSYGMNLAGPSIENESTVEDVDRDETVETVSEQRKQQENKEQQEKSTLQKEKEEEIESVLSKIEEDPTQENYDKLIELVNSLPNGKDKYSEQLAKTKEFVINEENKINDAEEMIAQAEEEHTEESLDKASKKVAALVNPSSEMEKRLIRVENDVEEKQRIIAEKEQQEQEKQRNQQQQKEEEEQEERQKHIASQNEKKEEEEAEKERRDQREEQERVAREEAERERLAAQEREKEQQSQKASASQETEAQESTEVANAV